MKNPLNRSNVNLDLIIFSFLTLSRLWLLTGVICDFFLNIRKKNSDGLTCLSPDIECSIVIVLLCAFVRLDSDVAMETDDALENALTFFLEEKFVSLLLRVNWDEVNSEQRVIVGGNSHGCNRQSLAVIRSLASLQSSFWIKSEASLVT